MPTPKATPVAGPSALWTAVLLQAIRDLSIPRNVKGVQGAIRKEAEAFFRGGEDLDLVCDMIGIEPAKVRVAYDRGELHNLGRLVINYSKNSES